MDIKVVLVLALFAYGIARLTENEPPECPPMPVTCFCNGTMDRTTIVTELIDDDDLEGFVCITVNNPFLFCESYGCEFYDPGRELPPKGMNIHPRKDHLLYPVGYAIPFEESAKSIGHRSPRRVRPPKPCYMKPLYSADVYCWTWGFFHSCNVTCISGYAHTVNNTSVRSWTTKCRFLENFWYPYEYDNCEPVGRNCDVELTGSGTLICTSPTEEYRYCDIECYADIFRETGNLSFARYPCTSDNYANELPWCATLRNVSVIEEPDYPLEDVYMYTGNYY